MANYVIRQSNLRGSQGAAGTLSQIANDRVLGNVSGSTAVPTALTSSQIRTLLGLATSSTVVFTNLSNTGYVDAVGRVRSGASGTPGSIQVWDEPGGDYIELIVEDGIWQFGGEGVFAGQGQFSQLTVDTTLFADGKTISAAEIGYLDALTGPIQTQINAKPGLSDVATATNGTNNTNAISTFQSRKAWQAGRGNGDLPRLRKAIWDCVYGATPKYVRIVSWGDSVGREFIGVRAWCALWRELGWGGIWYDAQASNGTFYLSTATGTYTLNSSDFSVKPNGFTIGLGSGATWTIQAHQQYDNSRTVDEMLWDTVTVCYVIEPGAGTFKISYRDGSGLPGVFVDAQTGISASGTLAFGSATINVPRTANTEVRITQTAGGTVRILGILAVDSQSSGAVLCDLTQGGINIEQITSVASSALYNGLMAVLKPNLVTWLAKDDPSQLANLDDFYNVMSAGWPYADWGFILPLPSNGSTAFTSDDAANTIIREYAIAEGHYCYDGREFARTWESGNRPIEPAKSVSSLTRSGSTATATCNSHGYVTGDYVTIAGASPSNFSLATVAITVVNANTFTYPVVASGATTATGTITAQRNACVNNDDAHLSQLGRDTFTNNVLRDMGLLGNILTAESRDIKSLVVDGRDLRYRGRSIVNDARHAIEESWKLTRGLCTGAQGVWSVKTGLPSVGTGDFTCVSHLWLRGAENWNAAGTSETQTFENANGIQLYRDGSTFMKLGIRNAGGTTIDQSYYFLESDYLNSIVCFAITRTSGAIRLYINGILASPFQSAGTASFADSIDSQYFRWAGSGITATHPVLMEGAFWNSALTQAQIESYYRSKIVPGSPAVLWRMRNNAGNQITDESGNGNHGEIWYNFNNNATPSFKWNAVQQPKAILGNVAFTTLYANQTYIARHDYAQCECTLPASPLVGDWVEVVGAVPPGGPYSSSWKIKQPANHQILEGDGNSVGTNATTIGTGGSITSTKMYDSIRLRCIKADTTTPAYKWVITQRSGTLTWV